MCAKVENQLAVLCWQEESVTVGSEESAKAGGLCLYAFVGVVIIVVGNILICHITILSNTYNNNSNQEHQKGRMKRLI
jgi:hypothetical protein